MTDDIVDRIAGTSPALAALRERRPQTRAQLQASYQALFHPVSTAHVDSAERVLVAAFATRLTATDRTSAFYAERALDADPQRARLVIDEAVRTAGAGPFGSYIERGLQGENTDGIRFTVDPALADAIGERLAAALAHTHLLVYRPREAGADDLERLLDAGWDEDGIVTLSQLISFLAFQQRVIAGLRVLDAAGVAGGAGVAGAAADDGVGEDAVRAGNRSDADVSSADAEEVAA
ncbi:CMD domain protein [Microbacterium sp. USHLN186]|uniref:CMD domain protein n=1 Tax=Microbacterium sp. USHLN186 TaxID=3081286 RepID=UPI00301AF4C8